MSLVFPNLQSVFTKKAKKSCLNIRSFIRVIKASNSDRSTPPPPSKSWNKKVFKIFSNSILTQKHFFLYTSITDGVGMYYGHKMRFQFKLFMILNYMSNSLHEQSGLETHFWPYQISRDHSFSTYAKFFRKLFLPPETHS